MSLPVTDPYYRVEVDAGPYSWVTEKGDPAGYGLADPLRVGWSLPGNNPLFHAQPDPMTASFSVIAATAADLAGLLRGAEVAIRVYGWPPGTDNPHAEPTDLDPVDYPPIVIFRGRVADATASPHKLGMIATYSCVDYTVDLAEATIGAGDWPQEGNNARFARMFNEAGVLAPAELFPGNYFFTSFLLNARTASPTDARSAIWQLVDWTTDDQDIPFGNYYAMQTNYAAGYLDGDVPDPLEPYVVPVQTTHLHTGDAGEAPRLPAVLAITQPGKYGVDIVEHADRRAAVINADHVDFKAVWSQSKRTDPDTVTVTGVFDDGTTSYTAAEPDAVPIAASFAIDVRESSVAQPFARANLSAADSDNWVADSFTWYADQDPWPMIADGLWFIEGMHVLASRYPVVVEGIDAAKNPSGLDWYAGRLKSATFVLAKGRYTVTFQLLRSLLRPQVFDSSIPAAGVGTLAWDDLDAAPLTTVAWSALDPAFTWFDARLLRSP
jgi:hypothetical protein